MSVGQPALAPALPPVALPALPPLEVPAFPPVEPPEPPVEPPEPPVEPPEPPEPAPPSVPPEVSSSDELHPANTSASPRIKYRMPQFYQKTLLGALVASAI